MSCVLCAWGLRCGKRLDARGYSILIVSLYETGSSSDGTAPLRLRPSPPSHYHISGAPHTQIHTALSMTHDQSVRRWSHIAGLRGVTKMQKWAPHDVTHAPMPQASLSPFSTAVKLDAPSACGSPPTQGAAVSRRLSSCPSLLRRLRRPAADPRGCTMDARVVVALARGG